MVTTNGNDAELLDVVNPLAATTFSNIKNNCASVLNISITSSDTSVQLVAGSGTTFPVAPFYCSCEYEVMYCSGKSGDTLTVARGQDGTLAAAHSAGTIIEQRNNAALWNDITLAVNKIENGTTPIPLNAPAGSITNTMLASDVARPSLLQNGSFDNWHKGNGPFSTNAQNTCDNWVLDYVAADTLTVTRDTANADTGGVCAAIVFTLSGGAGQSRWHQSNLAANDPGFLLSDLAGRQVTLTIRVRTSVANAIRASINDYYGAASHYTYSSYHTGNGLYQTLSLTTTLSAAPTIVQVGLNFNASCTVYVDNATLTYGAAPTLYQPAQIPDSIPNQRLASDVARANLLTNGGFEIWQRGAGPFGATAFNADRWYASVISGSFNGAIVRDSANADVSSGFCWSCTNHTGGSAASPDFLEQVVEISGLRGKTVTFSARVKVSVANAVRLQFVDADGTTTTNSAYHTGGGAYETLSLTAPVTGSGTKVYCRFLFEAACAPFLDNAMLVVGSVPADYVPLHPADDLARCERYYEVQSVPSGYTILIGQSTGVNTVAIAPYRVAKAITPSFTISGLSTWSIGGAGVNLAPTAMSGIPTALRAQISTTQGNIAAGTCIRLDSATGGYILLEANP